MFEEILDGDVYKYYSDGEWKKSSSGKSVAIINPTTRKTQYKVQGKASSPLSFKLNVFWFNCLFAVSLFVVVKIALEFICLSFFVQYLD